MVEDPLVVLLTQMMTDQTLHLGYAVEWNKNSVFVVVPDGVDPYIAIITTPPPLPPSLPPPPRPPPVATEAGGSPNWVLPIALSAGSSILCFCLIVYMSTKSIGYWCRVCCCKPTKEKSTPVLVGIGDLASGGSERGEESNSHRKKKKPDASICISTSDAMTSPCDSSDDVGGDPLARKPPLPPIGGGGARRKSESGTAVAPVLAQGVVPKEHSKESLFPPSSQSRRDNAIRPSRSAKSNIHPSPVCM